MLLRRLGSTLGVARPGSPLGEVVPVATSATLGGGSNASWEAMRRFAQTVFGCPFPAESVVLEERVTGAEWVRAHARAVPGAVPRPVAGLDLLAAAVRGASSDGPHAAADALLQGLFAADDEGAELSATDLRRLHQRGHLPALLAGHPLTTGLLAAARAPRSICELAAAVLPEDASPEHADGTVVVEAFLGLLSLARAQADGAEGRSLLGVDVQLWVREVSRVDRRVSATAAFRWADDGAHAESELHLPALYCRHCGRAGWGALRTVTGRAVDASTGAVRRASRAADPRFRAMMHAPGEAIAVAAGGGAADGLLWLDTVSLDLAGDPGADGETEESRHVPVLALWDDDKAARMQSCPSCQQPDGIRFLGSGVSTLTSVSLSSMFGSAHLDADEKKTLLFTDSVQDAAYTAGFVQARSHALSLRAALLDTVTAHGGLTLADLPREAVERAGTDLDRRYRLVPPAVTDWPAFRRFWEAGGTTQDKKAARALVERRLAFDTALEFGLNARTGRTLELTGSVVVEVDAGSVDTMRRVARRAIDRAREQHSLSPETDAALGAGISDSRLSGWVRGVLERLRTRGGIRHQWLDPYVEHDGDRWRLSGGRRAARDQGMPAFPPGRPAPTFPTTGTRSDTLDSLTGRASWYARWAQRQLGLEPRDGGLVTKALLEEWAQQGWLTTQRTEAGAVVFGLDPAQITISRSDDPGLVHGHLAVRCDVCRTLTPGSRRAINDLVGAACLRLGCPGRLHRAPRGEDYYRQLYASTDMRRVVAREHTSLLPDKMRLEIEDQFRDGTGPASPNVLAATPTLELGIDIGDLSTVLLGSLPRSVASYVQRVGRAGRLTGNALVLAYIRGRGQNVQRLAAPLETIDGEVRPPATYLDAVEILQRQYVAWLLDRRARDGHPDPGKAATLFPAAGWEPGTWAGDLLAEAGSDPQALVDAFLTLFGDNVRPDTAEHLRTWAGAGEPDPLNSGLAHLVRRAVTEHRLESDDLAHRQGELQDQLPELLAAAERATATDDEKRDARMGKAELGFVRRRRTELAEQFWVGALEQRGVLPNYSLLDDTVTLDVTLHWFDQASGEFNEEQRSYDRGSALALSEWAPGATFYAQGAAVRIDAVHVGTDLSTLLQTWRVCAVCGWSRVHRHSAGEEPPVPAACPRCGDPAVSDTGQALHVLPLEKVSAQVSRDAAAISDARDERERAQFSIVPAADVDPDEVTDAWQLTGYPFGAEYIRQVEVRWVNVGHLGERGAPRTLAGWEVTAPQFLVCPGCGVVPAAQRARDVQDARHRAWCRHRLRMDVPWAELSLGRTLRTQGVRVLIPPQFALDQFAGPSFRAALLLGLRELLGGTPDHLDVLEVHLPVDGEDRTALLLHDRVPGGTGYLADLARPTRVRELLEAALDVLDGCSCAEQELLACSRCLLPSRLRGCWSGRHVPPQRGC